MSFLSRPGRAAKVGVNDRAPPTSAPRDWRRQLIRALWYGLAGIAVVITVAAIPGYILVAADDTQPVGFVVARSPEFLAFTALLGLAMLSVAFLCLGMAWLLFQRAADDRMSLLVSFYLLLHGVTTAGPLESLESLLPGTHHLSIYILQPILVGPLSILVFAVFPDGRFVPRWTRWLVVFTLALCTLYAFLAPWGAYPSPATVTGLAIPTAFLSLISIAFALLYAQIYRYRHVSSTEQRQQTKWVVYGIGLWFVLVALSGAPWTVLQAMPPGSPLPWWANAATPIWLLSTAVFPVTLTFSVLRYRLWQVDLVINRTLVYGALTAGVILLYASVVGVSSVAMQSGGQLAGLALATVGVALAFKPMRNALQRGVDRLMYSKPGNTPAAEARAEDAGQTIRLSPLWQGILRPVWYACALLSFVIFASSLPFVVLRGAEPFPETVTPSEWLPLFALGVSSMLLGIATAGLCLLLAYLLFRKRFGERISTVLSFYLLAHGVLLAGPLELLEPLLPGIEAVNVLVFLPLVLGVLYVAILALFPDGRFVPSWTRKLLFVSVLVTPFVSLAGALTVSAPKWNENVSLPLAAAAGLAWATVIGIGFYAQVHRYRHVSNPLERQQTKWVLYGIGLWFALSLGIGAPWGLGILVPAIHYPMIVGAGLTLLYSLSNAVFPITLTLAVLRYRLWDVDLVINRTLVYGALTAMILMLYMVAVGGLSALFHTANNLVVSLLATGLAAILFQPLRERLQRGVNRVMYGERDDPHAVLSRLGKRLEASLSPEATLRTIVKTVGQAFKLPYVAIALKRTEGKSRQENLEPDRDAGWENEFEIVESCGAAVSNTMAFPLVYQSELVGQLIVAPRAVNERLAPGEQSLLEDIAYQTGVAAHNVRLTHALRAAASALQSSRERLVVAREEERRRLRRDLHDGLGPLLASQTLTLDAIAKAQAHDPARAIKLLRDLQAQSQVAVQDVRRLVYDLRPPALDDLGLGGALRELAAQYRSAGVRFVFDLPEPLLSLPAAVEVAAYRIGQEALTNVVRHAQARTCTVCIQLAEQELYLEVTDDGRGMPANWRSGIGLESMRERAAELNGRCIVQAPSDGGTRVRAWLPMHRA